MLAATYARRRLLGDRRRGLRRRRAAPAQPPVRLRRLLLRRCGPCSTAPGKGATDVRREAARIHAAHARRHGRRRRLVLASAAGAVYRAVPAGSEPARSRGRRSACTRSPARHEPPPGRRLRRPTWPARLDELIVTEERAAADHGVGAAPVARRRRRAGLDSGRTTTSTRPAGPASTGRREGSHTTTPSRRSPGSRSASPGNSATQRLAGRP